MYPATIRLSIAVMHHPARPECLARILGDLASDGVETDGIEVVDPDPYGPTNPWRTARLAWSQTPIECTHRLLLQDDALLCEGFPQAAALAVAAQPLHPVSFFVNDLGYQCARAQLDAAARLDAWAWLPTNAWYPTVATSLPRDMALDLADFKVARSIADDAVLAYWANARRIRVLQTVPSLVQHDEEAISTITMHNSRTRNRGASCFLGDVPHTAIDWSRGPR